MGGGGGVGYLIWDFYNPTVVDSDIEEEMQSHVSGVVLIGTSV